MKKLIFASPLLLLLLLSPVTPPSRARTCTDNDGDGETTCGRKIYGVRIYDCDDTDPYINACEQSTIHFPELYFPPDCSSSGIQVDMYNCNMPSEGPRPPGGCPAPGYPAELCPQIPTECTHAGTIEYLQYYQCS